MSDQIEFFNPRGIGSNHLPCFVCGHVPVHGVQADLAGFVDPSLVTPTLISHPLLDLVTGEGLLAHLDYRPSEPSHVQLKFGACGEHEPNLQLLLALSARNKSISAEILRLCTPGRKRP